MRSRMVVGALALAASGWVLGHGGPAGGPQGRGGPHAMEGCGMAGAPAASGGGDACPMGEKRGMGARGAMRGGPGGAAEACPMHGEGMASGPGGPAMRGPMAGHAHDGAAPERGMAVPEAPAK